MWLIKKVHEEGHFQYLVLEKKLYTVGRKNTDIVLNDNSISRTHCVIYVAERNECPFKVNTLTGIWLVDKNSKYGTFIQKNNEWVKIEGEKVEQLSSGSIIRFGLLDNIWRIEYKPVIACSSRLSATQTEEIKGLLSTIDGRLLSKWVKQCNVIFVNDITLTVKVLLALINGVPIVTTNYLTQLVECVKQNRDWPDYKLFRPEIKESTLISHLVSLNVEDHRKELFRGKTFVIPTKEQLNNLSEIIEAAGGKAELINLEGNCRKLANEDVIVIQLPCSKIINPDERAISFKNIATVLKNEYQTRIVPETEIFQAIAYSSTEKFCCPKSEAFRLRHCSYNQYSHGDIIEEETPTQSNIQHLSRNIVCSSTNEDDLLLSERGKSLSKKRNHSPEPDEIQKRFATEECGIVKDISESLEPKSSGVHQVVVAESWELGMESRSEDSTNQKRELPESPSQSCITGSKIGPKKQKSVKENVQSKLSDFWREPEKKGKTDIEKRKLTENENDDSAKRRCTASQNNSPASACYVAKTKMASDVVESNVSDITKHIKKYMKVESGDEGTGVFRWKEEASKMLDESFGQRRTCKKFVKTKQIKIESKYTEVEYQARRQLLLNDGWIEYRRKTETVVSL